MMEGKGFNKFLINLQKKLKYKICTIKLIVEEKIDFVN